MASGPGQTLWNDCSLASGEALALGMGVHSSSALPLFTPNPCRQPCKILEVGNTAQASGQTPGSSRVSISAPCLNYSTSTAQDKVSVLKDDSPPHPADSRAPVGAKKQPEHR